MIIETSPLRCAGEAEDLRERRRADDDEQDHPEIAMVPRSAASMFARAERAVRAPRAPRVANAPIAADSVGVAQPAVIDADDEAEDRD
mgnify:CR=1 FL=1